MDVTRLDPARAEVAARWRDLWWRCPDATAFQHPGWLLPWRARLAPDLSPCILGVTASGALVGLAPFGVHHDGARSELVLLGGDETDYRGILALPGARRAVAEALLRFIARAEFDGCTAPSLEGTSALLEGAPHPGLRIERRPQDVCPYLPIPPSARAPEDVVPRGFARRLAQSLRRARRAGRYQVVVHADRVPPEALETLFRLHTARFETRGMPGVLADGPVRDFHRTALPVLAREGLVRIVELRLGDAPAASLLALVGHGRVLHYVAGFDPEHAKHSPGRLVIRETLRVALAEGAREVDFLRGVEPYKYDWGAVDRMTWQVRILPGGGER